jgi:hypothetical protein
MLSFIKKILRMCLGEPTSHWREVKVLRPLDPPPAPPPAPAKRTTVVKKCAGQGLHRKTL